MQTFEVELIEPGAKQLLLDLANLNPGHKKRAAFDRPGKKIGESLSRLPAIY